MIIAMSCTHDWYKYLVIDLYSLLESTKDVKKIYLLLETDNINDIPYLEDIINKYKIEIKLINANNVVYKYLTKECPNLNTEFSNLSFSRLILADIIEENKVLYIDTDAIVRKDISNIWKYNISDYYIAGVKDYGVILDGVIDNYDITGKYINSGFVLFNLELIRKDNIVNKWFELINNKKLIYPDQDALNIICQNKELYIPSMYNSCEYAGDRVTYEVVNIDLIKVFHFVGPKTQWVVDRLHSEEWYDAEEKFYNEFGWNKYN